MPSAASQALHILLRGHIHLALEELSEVLDVAEATHLRHLHHVGLTLLESLHSLVDLIVVDKFDEGHAGHLLQFLVERGMTHGEFLRQEVHIKVRIAHVVVYYLATTQQELLLFLRVRALAACEIGGQRGGVALGYEAVNANAQQLQRYGLREEGVGSCVVSGDALLLGGLPGEDYHLYVLQLLVFAQGTQEAQSVELRHHHVTHDDVRQ